MVCFLKIEYIIPVIIMYVHFFLMTLFLYKIVSLCRMCERLKLIGLQQICLVFSLTLPYNYQPSVHPLCN